MCDNEKHFDVTFQYFHQKLIEYTSRVVDKLNLSEGEKFIDDFLIQNDLWKIFSNWMSKIFDYIDRFYLKDRKSNLKRICLETFKLNFLPKVKERLYTISINLVTDDRDDKNVDRIKIKKMLEILTFCDYEDPDLIKQGDEYFWINKFKEDKITKNNKSHVPPTLNEYFDNYFHPITKTYIEKKFTEKLATLSSAEYARFSFKYLKNEDERKELLFTNKTLLDKLNDLNKLYIIDQKAQDIAEKDTGFEYLLKNEKYQEMKDIYDLLYISGSKDTYKWFTNIFDKYIKEEGKVKTSDKDSMKDPKSKCILNKKLFLSL
jgi:hypothetical protein